MEEIAAAAGTSKSIVYRYFTDKTGLQMAVAEAVVARVRDALAEVLRTAPTPYDGLRAMVGVYLETVESSPHVYAFVTRDGSVDSVGHFLDSVTALVAAPFAGTADDAAGLVATWAAGAVGFVRGAAERWVVHCDDPGTPDRETLAGLLTDWLWAGAVGLLGTTRTTGGPRTAGGTPTAGGPRTAGGTRTAADAGTVGDPRPVGAMSTARDVRAVGDEGEREPESAHRARAEERGRG